MATTTVSASRLAGELTADSYVVDFVVMKDIVRTLIKRWDHRFLLPLQNPHLRISEQEDAWEIEFAGEEAAAFLREHGRIRYAMPKWAVVPLPVITRPPSGSPSGWRWTSSASCARVVSERR